MYMVLNEGKHPFFSTRKEKDYFIKKVREQARLVFRIENLNQYPSFSDCQGSTEPFPEIRGD